MLPIYDVDVLLLLATFVAAKRRPAELSDIVAAIDLINGNIPAEGKLCDAFARLGKNGLLGESAGSVRLSPMAEKIVEALPRKAEMADSLVHLKAQLSQLNQSRESVQTDNDVSLNDGAAIVVTPEQLRAAMLDYRASVETAGKNMLVPKPKQDPAQQRVQQRPGQRQRKPTATKKWKY